MNKSAVASAILAIIRRAGMLTMKIGLCTIIAAAWSLSALATADGPDHYRVIDAPPTKGLEMRREADQQTEVLGVIPATATCLRNLGCVGGLSIDEFNTLSAKERATRQAANPRWCNVEYQGRVGWVEGRYLAEGACPGPSSDPNQRTVVLPGGKTTHALKGRIRGDAYVDYTVRVAAGQALSVALKATHSQNYFNVQPNGATSAMFIGSSAGNRFERVAPADGDYVVRVYLMRAAARRKCLQQLHAADQCDRQAAATRAS